MSQVWVIILRLPHHTTAIFAV